MSKLTDYMADAVGYDQNGLPASSIQFTFGMSPFQVAETESIENVTEITSVCQSEAIVDMKVVDDVAMVTFDFSMEVNVLAELAQELEMYNQQKGHVTESLNNLMAELMLAERNEDEDAMEKIYFQMRSMSIPFMIPTILPVIHGGTVHLGFADDPKFIFFTSDHLNQVPYKVTMIFEAKDLFCQDELGVYFEDTEAEIRAQQEEMFYMDEARKIEEENYQAQFGSNAGLYGDYLDEEQPTDKRMKGVRIK